ncbi:MAG: ribosome recycling factor [Gammaproteobacteria bacterium]|uniref:Ribosome-recycling factor n=1 Tax=Candidatus Thiopontia autotrophica TaxID=2841688 RepID=A0A8J6TW36_9GAMM|nr:ribosome recycling factor [Candidatus Thiopontia autotrophica]MBL6969658.1 ribosome recycling factor [Gammaproteobacteria bacterium]
MINEIKQDAKGRMGKSVESLKGELSKLRAGRAHPSLLEQISVDYYGSSTPLNQVANVTATDSRTLTIVPWEKTMVQPIEKAIMEADLGLNPATAGTIIRIPLPPLTEERRRDLVRVVKHEGESAKVAIRNIRRDANSDFRDLLKEKEISEDEEHDAIDDVQKLTDQHVAEVGKIVQAKEDDLMEI